MTHPTLPVTRLDLDLLEALTTAPTLVAACRRLGISRDRGVYRLDRWSRIAGGPVVRAEHGGRFGGGSRLTALGHAVLRRGTDAVALTAAPAGRRSAATSVLQGTYRRRPEPTVDLGRGVSLHVTFQAEEGETVYVAVDPESVLLARGTFASSARNRFVGRVDHLARRSPTTRDVAVNVGAHRFRAAVTERSARELGLAPGRRVVLYVKATAVRRLPRPVSRERPRR
ncbi:MAG: TOBE domain-containing protein [Thermoplasmata archaeon]|nr:TOBE domain-containing protein [Thermoplasmata archaeon]